MCSSPKTNSCYAPPKKPTRSILAGFTAEQRRAFAEAANRAQDRKVQQQQQQQSKPTRERVPMKHQPKNSSHRKNAAQSWQLLFIKIAASLKWTKWWPARDL